MKIKFKLHAFDDDSDDDSDDDDDEDTFENYFPNKIPSSFKEYFVTDDMIPLTSPTVGYGNDMKIHFTCI